MPTTRTTKTVKKVAAKTHAKPTAKAAPRSAANRSARSAERMTLAEAMHALEKAGSAQTRKTYARHGAEEPMFGVSFAVMKTLV
jgi:hypothetical protein